VNFLKIQHPTGIINGEIYLSGSKSISNRALLIRALCGQHFEITNLSNSDDTITMEKLITVAKNTDVLDAHHAGTTFRFLTAYLALTTTKPIVLTGSERMQQRPIKALVDALNSIGANITYNKNDGYPPITIDKSRSEWKNEIDLSAQISSQYISALLMIAPYLPNGLKLNLIGDIVSLPYIDMTIKMMQYFGVKSEWLENQSILVPSGPYKQKDFYVEADWSSASYFYSIVSLASKANIVIHGLQEKSIQADREVVSIYRSFGVETTFGADKIHLYKSNNGDISFLEKDFINCPDLTQTVAVTLAGLGAMGLFSGLQTLHIKETDRVAALMNELAKYGVYLSKLPPKFSSKSGITFYSQEGKAEMISENDFVETYNDHRMAMAFAPLGLLFPISIVNPEVVSKSYPTFWQDLTNLGFTLTQKTIQDNH
jgi:3-phosphoshikimate 1-carboxyvinyltransferase